MSLLPLLALFLLWLSCTGLARAGEPSPPPPTPRIWSGLILATNDVHPSEAPARLRKFADKLKNIFGYNQFELIGEYSEKMGDPDERWLIPSKDFYLSVKSHTGAGGHYPMKIVLFQNRRRLAEFETRLSPESPLFIRGPLYARGQLVIVLHVVDPSDISAGRVLAPLPPHPVVGGMPFPEAPEKHREPEMPGFEKHRDMRDMTVIPLGQPSLGPGPGPGYPGAAWPREPRSEVHQP